MINDIKLLNFMALNEFKKQYKNSFFGILWAFIRPLIFILVVWSIFSLGFKNNISGNGIPFIIYLLSGYIPWIFISESISGSQNIFIQNRYLLNQPNFNFSFILISKVISYLYIHIIFIVFFFFILLYFDYPFSLSIFQLPIFTFFLLMFCIGISLFFSTLKVFIKDISEFLKILFQIGFWVTPIFWSESSLPEKYMWLTELNPAYYFINAYRNILLNDTDLNILYFLILISLSFASLLIGIYFYNKLRPLFGDIK